MRTQTPAGADPLQPVLAALSPAQIRHIAWLDLHLRRWESMMDAHHAKEAETGDEIPAWAWHAYDDAAEEIAERLVFFRDSLLAPPAG